MTLEELRKAVENKELFLHHTATAQGYISRKSSGYVVEYNGKFGKGFKHCLPNFNSTYYYLVTYYIYK